MSILLLIACGEHEVSQDYVARVYDRYLTRADLSKHIPATANHDDSLKRAKVYINNWVREQVVLERARFNIDDEDPRLQAKLDAYLNDLLIYEYEQQLVKQNMDTSATRSEMTSFLEGHEQDFKLERAVVRAAYLTLPEGVEDEEKIARQFKRYNEEDSLALAITIAQQEFTYQSRASADWTYLSDLCKLLTFNEDYVEARLDSKSTFDKTDGGMRYIIEVVEYRKTNELVPLVLVEEKIKRILLNSKKQDLLENMRNKLFQDALEQSQIEIIE